MVKYKKAETFYETFDRKGKGQTVTHYCPGCGHGNVHKILAEAIEDFGIQDRTIVLSPVGCAAFCYYYFDTGNVACAHGRAPAVATGIKRSREDSIVISYQGDGDLAGIGAAEIIHAANRGEQISVFFINNAIYGMTGGQMAPTTLLGQHTMTSPLGRDRSREGGPIHMCELINELDGPVFIERVSLADSGRILKARKAIRKALQNQIEKKGFSFVEILSPCPINWKMTPVEARTWIKENMEEVFPVKKFKDQSGESGGYGRLPELSGDELFELLSVSREENTEELKTEISDVSVKIAGFGGQGVMSAGILLANCAIHEGINASWLPSYGPEMRGGSANAGVVMSADMIGSPVVDNPDHLIVMNGPSLDRFEDSVVSGGSIYINTSLIKRKAVREDVRIFEIPATELAGEADFIKGANIIMLTVLCLSSGIMRLETLKKIIPLSLKRKEFIDINMKMIEIAGNYYEKNL